MYHHLKKYKNILIWICLSVIVNVLMCVHLLDRKHVAFLGIASRKGLLLAQIIADLAVGAVCLGGFYLAKKKIKLYIAAIVVVSPFINVCLMEGITGYLGELNRDAFWINVAIAYCLQILFLLFFQKIKTAVILQSILLPVIGLVQYYVYSFRGRSFMLSDLRTVGTAAEVARGYSYGIHFASGLALLLAVGWLFLILCCADFRWKRRAFLRKILVICLCVGGFFYLSDETLVSHHKSLELRMWNVDKNYWKKGMLLTLASQVQYLTADKPEGYSVGQVKQVAEKYTDAYAKSEKNSLSGDSVAVIPQNIIVIMNESLADLRIYSGCDKIPSVMPYLDSMEKNVRKGWLSVPVFGGGTANTEYEVLTGNCMAFWNDWTIAYQVYAQEKECGLADTLKQQGYHTIAMHPYRPLNYNRKAVYEHMGFDEFYANKNWDSAYSDKIRRFVSDQVCYDYVIDMFEKKDSEEKTFSFLVTMQNHALYTAQNFVSSVELDTLQDYPEAEQYFSLVQESDRAFRNLTEYFTRVSEPTMIVLFGDHHPNLQDGFYDMIAGQYNEQDMNKYKRERTMSPYVVWTNYENTMECVPVMGSEFFGSYLLQGTGLEMTSYNKCILEFLRDIRVVTENEVMDAQGNWYPLDQLPEQYAEILNDYEILQHNNVFGRGQRQEELFRID